MKIGMQIPITLRILSSIRRYEADVPFDVFLTSYKTLAPQEPEQSTVLRSGALSLSSEGSYTLSYQEEEDTVFIRWQEGAPIRVLRQGKGGGYELCFEKGKVTPFAYHTAFGGIEGALSPLRMENNLSAKGGCIYLQYLSTFGGVLQQNTLKITVVS